MVFIQVKNDSMFFENLKKLHFIKNSDQIYFDRIWKKMLSGQNINNSVLEILIKLNSGLV